MVLRLIVVFGCLMVAGQVTSAQLSIHSMVVGEKALELKENRQLTFGSEPWIVDAEISPDGKRIAYLTEEKGKVNLCLVRSSGGNATTVMSGTDTSHWRQAAESESGKGWCVGTRVAWSPNSKMLAFLGRLVVGDEDEISSTRDHVLVLASNGAHIATLPLPEFVKLRDNLVFSPDSNTVAAKVYNLLDHPTDEAILVFNLDGSSRMVYKSKDHFELLDWKKRAFLLTKEGLGRNAPLARVWLDGREPEKIDESHRWLSPDGRLCVLPDGKPDIVVKNVGNDKSWVVVKGKRWSFRHWLPNSRMITYDQRDDVIDKTQGRRKTLRSIWIAGVTSTKMNTMCVAIDHHCVEPSWSSDCMKMAYVQRDRLYVAELGWREPTVHEKLAAGMQLSEEEEKHLLQSNGKEIGVALQIYWNDWDGRLPSPETVLGDLQPYMKLKDLYLRPGTQEVIFKYIDPGVEWENEIQADTVIGILDPGAYDWVVNIYADTHVRVVPREE